MTNVHEPLNKNLETVLKMKYKLWPRNYPKIHIFAYTIPNRSAIRAIDNPNQIEQVFDFHLITLNFL